MSDEIDSRAPRQSVPRSEAGPNGVSTLRPVGHAPPLLSVAVVGVVAGLLVGLGIGSRLDAVAPRPAPVATPAWDIQADSVSSRLKRAFESGAPGGWAVCTLGGDVGCRPLVARDTDPRVPPSEYGQGWYGNLGLTRVTVSPAHLVLAVGLGDGAVAAYLNQMGPGDTFLHVDELTPVDPGRHGTFYFDLGNLAAGHYVAQLDFMAVPPSQSAGVIRFYVVGFVVS